MIAPKKRKPPEGGSFFVLHIAKQIYICYNIADGGDKNDLSKLRKSKCGCSDFSRESRQRDKKKIQDQGNRTRMSLVAHHRMVVAADQDHAVDSVFPGHADFELAEKTVRKKEIQRHIRRGHRESYRLYNNLRLQRLRSSLGSVKRKPSA